MDEYHIIMIPPTLINCQYYQKKKKHSIWLSELQNYCIFITFHRNKYTVKTCKDKHGENCFERCL